MSHSTHGIILQHTAIVKSYGGAKKKSFQTSTLLSKKVVKGGKTYPRVAELLYIIIEFKSYCALLI